uniref:Drug metabolite transporter superfamily n=1 Tax=Tetraselmis sp. GSL018 TaxID=582737 RepID=A0A061S9Z2_9CHLO
MEFSPVRIEPVMPSSSATTSPLFRETEVEVPVVLGLWTLNYGRRVQLIILSFGTIVSAIGFSSLQESVFRIPGFRFGGWMTFWMYVTYLCCSAFERLLTGDLMRHGRLRHYALASFLAMSGMYLTNCSVAYISYVTRMVFKSSKILPVMLLGTLLLRKRYAWQEYAAALLMAIGLSVFASGDLVDSSVAGGGRSSVHGIALITTAILAESGTANVEEKFFFRCEPSASQAEVMFYMSLMSTGSSLALLLLSGELVPAAEHSVRRPEVVPRIVASSTCGYISVSIVLTLIKYFDATQSEIVKSMRKILQVAVSFLVFWRPINARYALGGAAVAAALFWVHSADRSRHRGLMSPQRAPRDPSLRAEVPLE